MSDTSCPKHKHHTYGCKACKGAQLREDERVFRETGKVPDRANGRTWVEALMEHQHVGGHCWKCEASRWAKVELEREAAHVAALEARVARMEKVLRELRRKEAASRESWTRMKRGGQARETVLRDMDDRIARIDAALDAGKRDS